MPEPNLFKIFTKRLDDAGLRYMVTGAVASIVYGEPRLTHDIDLVLVLSDEGAGKIIEAFPLEEFYCPPVEVIKVELKRPLRGHFNLVHHETGFKADVYLMGKDPLHNWSMSKRRQMQMEGNTLWVAPPEYVIVRKLEYYREGKSEKHLKDIVSMITISEKQIDFEDLQDKIKNCSLEKEWKEVQKLRREPDSI